MKKTILTLALTLMLTGTAFSEPVSVVKELAETEFTEEVVAPSEGQKIDRFADPVPAENGAGEVSKIARRMTKAEKAQNAAENDGWGGAITIIAMCIVISALAVLSLLFLGFGKISQALLTRTKKKAKAAADHEPTDNHDLAPGEVIAAISLALSEHFAEGHDVEDTILTIRRMQKAYSPWNSKIYNLRTVPHRK